MFLDSVYTLDLFSPKKCPECSDSPLRRGPRVILWTAVWQLTEPDGALRDYGL